MYIAGFANTSDKGVFVLSIITSILLIIIGTLFIVNYPKKLSHTATFEGVLVELNKTKYSIKVKGLWHYGAYEGYIQKTFDITKDDLLRICEFIDQCQIDSINVRVWSEKEQSRQIEMNGSIVKKYDWWKYAKPALWLMVLPGTIFLICLIVNRKQYLKDVD